MRTISILLIFTLWASSLQAQSLLADINQTSADSDPVLLGFIGDYLYVSADDQLTGRKLWRTNGDVQEVVTSFDHNAEAHLYAFTQFQESTYFAVSQADESSGLWRYDGITLEQISNLLITNPGLSFQTPFPIFNGAMYFSANDGQSGSELWRYNGQIIERLTNINPTGNANPKDFTQVGSLLYFTADDGLKHNLLWRTDGRNVQQVLDRPLPWFRGNLTAFQDQLYFLLWSESEDTELWRSDSLTTERVGVLSNSNRGIAWDPFVRFAGQLYIEVYNLGKWAYWRTDGTELTPFFEFGAPPHDTPQYGSPEAAIVHNGFMYWGTDPNPRDANCGLWKSDGTDTICLSTERIRQSAAHGKYAYFVSYSSFPSYLSRTDGISFERVNNFILGSDPSTSMFLNTPNHLYFVASNGDSGIEVWRTDGVSFSLFADIATGTADGVRSVEPIPFDGFVFFTGDDGESRKMWRTNGRVVEPLEHSPVLGYGFTALGAWIYFVGWNADHPDALWRTNRSHSIFEKVTDQQVYAFEAELTPYKNHLYYVIRNPREQLWRTDGSVSEQVSELAGFKNLTVFRDQLFFSAYNRDGGVDIYTSIGNGVRKLTNLRSSVSPQKLTIFDNWIYFIARVNRSAPQLWRTNGEQTFQIFGSSESTSVDAPFELDKLVEFDGYLYFLVRHNWETYTLWRTNGVETDPVEGEFSSIGEMVVVGDHLYFVAAHVDTGNELWRTDGTSTELVADIHPDGSSSPRSLTRMVSYLYFSADDGTSGRELWRTNGEDTELIADLKPGLHGSEPSLMVLNNRLLIAADDGRHGRELWTFSPEEWEVQVRQQSSYDAYSSFPNPFSEATTLTLSLTRSQNVRIHLVDVWGRRIRTLHDGFMYADIPYEISLTAGSLPSGIYLYHIVGDYFQGMESVVLVR